MLHIQIKRKAGETVINQTTMGTICNYPYVMHMCHQTSYGGYTEYTFCLE